MAKKETIYNQLIKLAFQETKPATYAIGKSKQATVQNAERMSLCVLWKVSG